MTDNLQPTGEFLLYTTEDGKSRVECRFENETIWLSQAIQNKPHLAANENNLAFSELIPDYPF